MISGEDVSDFVPFLFQKAKKLYVNRPNEERKKKLYGFFLNFDLQEKIIGFKTIFFVFIWKF